MALDTDRKRSLRILAGSLAIIVSYALLRTWLRAEADNNRVGWIVKDFAQNGPRLLMLVAFLVLGLVAYGRRNLGLHLGRPLFAAVAGALIASLGVINGLLRSTPFALTAQELTILTIGSIIVGVNEELAFRGVVYRALADWRGNFPAVWGSTVLFTVFHLGAQPIWAWPLIFALGLTWAMLRWAGVGLIWLMVIHATYDTAIFWTNSGYFRYPIGHVLVLCATGALAGSIALLGRTKPAARNTVRP